MKARTFVLLLSCTACATGASAQDFDMLDILIRGGHVLDARNDIDGVMDLAIDDGVIAEVAASIDPSRAETVVDAAGLYVTPGLIDRSRTRVLAFLNIVGSGMKGGPVEQNLADMDAKLTAIRAAEFPELIVGVKVAHYAGDEWDPVDRAVAAGEAAGLPVAVDFGGHVPPLSLEDLFMTHLRPGDIFTHTYASVRGRISVVDDGGNLRPFVRRARERGIVFDVGHGAGSFLFSQAIPAMDQGFPPDTISTDLHRASMNAGMKDMLNVMSKFLVMGMSLEDVIHASTWRAAQAIHRDDLGHLSVGAEADVTVLRLRESDFGFVDVGVRKLEGDQKLECELTLRAGEVVWDLN